MSDPDRVNSRWHRQATGTAPYLAEMLFLQMADMKMTHVHRVASIATSAAAHCFRGRSACFLGPDML
jgi:hypothetical protein